MARDAFQDYVTLRQTATATGKTYSSLYARAARGDFGEALNVGGTHLYRRSLVERALAREAASRTVPASGMPAVAGAA